MIPKQQVADFSYPDHRGKRTLSPSSSNIGIHCTHAHSNAQECAYIETPMSKEKKGEVAARGKLLPRCPGHRPEVMHVVIVYGQEHIPLLHAPVSFRRPAWKNLLDSCRVAVLRRAEASERIGGGDAVGLGDRYLFLKETSHAHKGARTSSWGVVEAGHVFTSNRVQGLWRPQLPPVIQCIVLLHQSPRLVHLVKFLR